MSRQRSLEQDRAKAAWNKVTAVVESNRQLPAKERFDKEYGSLAKSAPADIQMNGLGQTLAFWRAKGYKDGEPKKNDAHAQLLRDVSGWVLEQLKASHKDGLLGWVMADETKTDDYRRATAEAMAFLNWLKRFAEAELPRE